MSRAPDRVLVQSLGRASRPSTAGSGRPSGVSWHAEVDRPERPHTAPDIGMGRAVSRIMTRDRVRLISFAAKKKEATYGADSGSNGIQRGDSTAMCAYPICILQRELFLTILFLRWLRLAALLRT